MSEEETMTEGNREMTNNTAGALIALVVGFALGLIIAWIYWLQWEERREPTMVETVEEERLTLEPEPVAVEEGPSIEKESEPDDLTRVEGIGPKMSTLLAESGVVTFEQLAGCDPEDLRDMLREAGLPFADPTTWPEQAALAAGGAWDELAELQDELSGGRRLG